MYWLLSSHWIPVDTIQLPPVNFRRCPKTRPFSIGHRKSRTETYSSDRYRLVINLISSVIQLSSVIIIFKVFEKFQVWFCRSGVCHSCGMRSLLRLSTGRGSNGRDSSMILFNDRDFLLEERLSTERETLYWLLLLLGTLHWQRLFTDKDSLYWRIPCIHLQVNSLAIAREFRPIWIRKLEGNFFLEVPKRLGGYLSSWREPHRKNRMIEAQYHRQSSRTCGPPSQYWSQTSNGRRWSRDGREMVERCQRRNGRGKTERRNERELAVRSNEKNWQRNGRCEILDRPVIDRSASCVPPDLCIVWSELFDALRRNVELSLSLSL